MTKKPKYRIEIHDTDYWRWNVVDQSCQVVLTSKLYIRKSLALRAARRFAKTSGLTIEE